MANRLMVDCVLEELDHDKTGKQRTGRGQLQPLNLPHLLKVLPPNITIIGTKLLIT